MWTWKIDKQLNVGYINLAASDSDVYGWGVGRSWLRPWKYDLTIMYIGLGMEDVTYRNLPQDELVGYLKVLDLWKEKLK